MKVSLKFLSILGVTVLLASCGTNNTLTNNPSSSPKTPIITPEIKDLSNKMIEASKDLTTTQLIWNIIFKSYDKLVVKYGTDSKILSQSKEFQGKEGFVVLTNLKPDTQYMYEIYNNTSKISNGTVKTQKK